MRRVGVKFCEAIARRFCHEKSFVDLHRPTADLITAKALTLRRIDQVLDFTL
jgi:hypothetical protein